MRGDQTYQLQFFNFSGSDPAYNALALLGNILDLQRAAKGILLITFYLVSFY